MLNAISERRWHKVFCKSSLVCVHMRQCVYFFEDGWTGGQIVQTKPDDSASGCRVFSLCFSLCVCVCAAIAEPEQDRQREGEGEEGRREGGG